MDEAIAYNALNVAQYGDPLKMRKIANRFSSWRAAWRELSKDYSSVNAEKEWEKLEKNGVEVIFAKEERFPKLLKEIAGGPIALYFKGNLFDDNPRIAVVGTRKATLAGREVAKSFSKFFANQGVAVISGLALGVDTTAHEGALEVGGKTIAVLANGLDWVYPRQNAKLAEKILDNDGALVSEYPIGSESWPHRFLERNRIISGLSLGTLVVEAPIGSGSLATANFAVEQNREVFVLPGPISHENYRGSHELLRAGARLVSDPENVFDDLNLPIKNVASQSKFSSANDGKQNEILAVIKEVGEPVDIDKICELSKIEVSVINRSLTFLAIQGLIKEEGGKYFI
ncbi:MAG: DNA-protecting protein DprA [Candidatus Harrisonbacteria bacterium]|nr:DNA-protecting protein DprA [Candidatus Harrisonbacteria bacterium]